MAHRIDFWLTLGSTYTYLTIMRLEEVEAEYGVTFNLRPFYLGQLFNEMGRWPFPDGAAKTGYMWRDIERRANVRGLTPALPAPYPAPESVLANKVAQIAVGEDLGRAWIKAAYQSWFEDGYPNGGEENLARSLAAVGQDKDGVIAAAEADATHAAIVSSTDEARALGVFGAPSFSVGDELFWGDDRLEDAAALAVAHA